MVKRKRKNMNGSNRSGKTYNEVSKVGNDQAVDFFSSLPDNIFAKIFSLLTMKEAIYTCVSCKKLNHLTAFIPYVEFKETADGCLKKKRKFVESVSRFLNDHDTVVRKFQLSFRPGEYMSDVLHWLSLVVQDGIEELDLMLDDRNSVEIPASLLTAGTLRVLKLRHCMGHLPSVTGFKSLKSLLLGDMYISDDLMGLLCCRCESLQHLTLEKCSGFEEIKIVDPRSKLETLILDTSCPCLSRLIFLSLKTLVIRKRDMNFSFIGCPHIDDLVLYREEEAEITRQESENMKDNIINRLQFVRSLHLAGWAFQCFAAYRSMDDYQLTNLEVLKLDFNACLYNQTELNNLINHADSLETLCISLKQDYSAGGKTVYTDRNFERVFANFLDKKYEVGSTVRFKNYADVSNDTLQIIEIKDFTGTIYEVSYIKFVLAHFLDLRVIKVTPIKEMDEYQSHAYAELFSRFPRVSTNVYILVGSEEVWKCEEA